jgi:hypothetical protein
MKNDGAMRLVISPEEAKSLIRYYNRTEQELPKWAVDYDGESCVWLEEDEA